MKKLLIGITLLALVVTTVLSIVPAEATPIVPEYLRLNDPHTIKLLEQQGINTSYVGLHEDYNLDHPYSRTYKNYLTNEMILEVGGLPMVNAAGQKVIAGWNEIIPGKHYKLKTNVFHAEVIGNRILLVTLNDQPDGKKKDDTVTYKPQLFLNGIEQSCGSPTLLGVDPVNPNYYGNVIEWDYGICKRQIRIVEGMFRATWIFSSNPNGEVYIKYNQAGNYRLKLGQYAISEDEELVPTDVLNSVDYPFTVSDSDTFYPDEHPETSSVDGMVYIERDNVTWATLIADPGFGFNDSAPSSSVLNILSGSESNRWDDLTRAILLFDSSDLPDDATISAATLSLYGSSKVDFLSITPDLNVYSSNPASNTALAAGDFDSLGSTAFATAITYASFSATGYNDFTLNSSGIAAISKTGVSKFGVRNANYDAAGTPPTWSSTTYSRLYGYFAEQGSGYKPKLVVTYIPPIVAPTVTTQAVTNIADTSATGNGNITDTGGENCSKRGVCWNTTGDPTVADDKSEETDSFGTGAFTRPMTGLSPGQHYYVRAYAYNSQGYGYGSQVEFTTQSKPVVTSQAGTNVEETTATWNGNITSTGGVTVDYRGFVWDTVSRSDPGDVAPASSSYANFWIESGSYPTGAYIYDVTGLTHGSTWYYRACVHNSYGWDYSNTQQTVYTKPGDPSNLAATPISSSRIDLTWTIGTGSEKSMVRGKTGTYPTSPSDGYEVYFDTGASCSDTDLDEATTYFYRVWAWDENSGYSDGYSQASETTLLGDLHRALWLRPDSIISGTTVQDRQGPSYEDGTITWGTNPSNITLSISGLILTPIEIIPSLDVPPDVIGTSDMPDMYPDGPGEGFPLYGFISTSATMMGIPIMLIWSLFAATLSIIVGILVYRHTEGSIPMTALGTGFTLGVLAIIGNGVVGAWFVVVYAIIAISTTMLHSRFAAV